MSLPKEATCSEAIEILSKSTGNDKKLIEIIENGKPVDKETWISDLPKASVIPFAVHPEVRIADPNYVTNKLDMINDWDDDARVEMSCGHAINPDTLYDYCWNEILTNKITFKCPAMENKHSCDSEWEFPEVSLKACLSNDERVLFETRLNLNWVNKNQEIGRCPSCMEFCERQDSGKSSVQCFYCKKAGRKDFIFCWYCLMPWEDNHLCSIEGADSMLQSCALKKIGETEGCPSLRACPNCKSFIEHSEKCRKMKCQYCNHEFCFICLSAALNGNYQCGDENNPCNIAPIQSFN